MEALGASPDQGASCCNIDSDLEANQLSKSLCEILGISEEVMTFRCTEVGKANVDLYGFDVVFLAALVGQTQIQKQKILECVTRQMRPGAMVVLRGAQGLRSLLYPVSC